MPNLKINIFFQSLYQLLNTLLPLITVPYISRVLGAENIGINSYTVSIASYFIIFAMLGINTHGSRVIAAVRDDRDKLNKTFSDLFFLHIGMSILVLFAYVLFLLFFVREFQIIFTVQIILILSALFDINWFFSGIEKFKIMVTRSGVIRLVYVISIFVFIKAKNDLWIYVLISSLAALIPNVVIWFFLRKFVSLIKPSWDGIKSHIKPLVVLFISVIAANVYGRMNKIMLATMTNETQLGLYANSEKIYEVVMGFIFAFNGVMIPRMSNIITKGDDAEKKRLILISMKYVMLLAFASTFGISAIAIDFAPLFFGQEFIDCGILTIGLCAMIPVITFSHVIASQHILPNSKDKIYTIAIISGAVACMPANLILIPKFQALGAVMARFSAEMAICIIITISARKSLPILTYIKNCLPFFLVGVAMLFLVRYIGGLTGKGVIPILIQVGVGLVFYLGVSTVYLYISKDEFFSNNLKKLQLYRR